MQEIDIENQKKREERLKWLKSSENKYEFCVICLKLLPYLKKLDVEFRHDITPAGDVCPVCRREMKT